MSAFGISGGGTEVALAWLQPTCQALCHAGVR
jgi:hypothetical protein